MPALLTRMSTGPRACSTAATAALASASLEMSALTKVVARPVASSISRAVSAPLSARSTMATLAPCLGQPQGDGLADASGAAGDQRHPAVQRPRPDRPCALAHLAPPSAP